MIKMARCARVDPPVQGSDAGIAIKAVKWGSCSIGKKVSHVQVGSSWVWAKACLTSWSSLRKATVIRPSHAQTSFMPIWDYGLQRARRSWLRPRRGACRRMCTYENCNRNSSYYIYIYVYIYGRWLTHRVSVRWAFLFAHVRASLVLPKIVSRLYRVV